MNKKMRARKRRQARRVALTLVLMLTVALVSIGGTIAWLTATSTTVTNTFTVGNITIKLDEAKLDGTGRTTEGNTDYKLYPGATIAKDPTVTVNSGSEPCYVYACIENKVLLADGTAVVTPNINSAWKKVGESGNKTVYVYVNTGNVPVKVDASDADQKLPAVFETVSIATTVTEANIGQLDDTGDNADELMITAYAHQSNEVEHADATTAALTKFGVQAVTPTPSDDSTTA